MTTATVEARMNNPLMMFPNAFKAIQGLHEATSAGGLPVVTVYMVHLRASQINGCSFCAAMHSREMREAGESDERIFTVAAWARGTILHRSRACRARPDRGPNPTQRSRRPRP